MTGICSRNTKVRPFIPLSKFRNGTSYHRQKKKRRKDDRDGARYNRIWTNFIDKPSRKVLPSKEADPRPVIMCRYGEQTRNVFKSPSACAIAWFVPFYIESRWNLDEMVDVKQILFLSLILHHNFLYLNCFVSISSPNSSFTSFFHCYYYIMLYINRIYLWVKILYRQC